MKKLIKTTLFATALTAMLTTLGSCQKMDPTEENVSFYLTYTITTDNGLDMPGTKTSSAEVFNEFYQEIKSGELVAPSYNFTFTEKTTGAIYTINGTWAGKDMVTLRTGTYNVVGTSTASGDNIQDKCSLKFDDEITVDVSSKTIVLKAKYDCSLIIFSDASISALSNFNGNTSSNLFKFNNYIYAFIHTQLYVDGKQAAAYLEGRHTNDTQFKIYTGNLNYEIGKFYVYNDINAAFELEKMEEGGNESSVQNLSIDGTANCYIVPSAGAYKFKADVKGNSTESLNGTAAKAEVLWETFNNDVQPNVGDLVSDVQLVDNYVCFNASGEKGNSLIVVKDSSDEILWSWHIWSTNYSPEQEYDVYNGHDDIKVMNRNLGAMSSTPGQDAIGLIYQWGRKDPFMGSSSVSSYIAFACTYSFPDCITSTSSIGTDEYASQHPAQYILANSQNNDWRNTSNDGAWSSSKTINDPCPKGWRIPDGGSDCIWSNFPTSYGTGCSWDSTNKGLVFSTAYSSNEGFYPAQGLHADSNDYYNGFWAVGTEGRYWTTRTDGIGADYFNFGTTSVRPYYTGELTTHFARANGYPARCCSE